MEINDPLSRSSIDEVQRLPRVSHTLHRPLGARAVLASATPATTETAGAHAYDRAVSSERLQRQVEFLLEADKLKAILRRTPLIDNSRQENSAEHSWHLTVAAVTLAEYAPAGTDLLHALRLLIVHDLVEIDAGDTFAYDPVQQESKAARELAAAERIFGLLPDDQGAQLREWWDEFEAVETPAARFANALDRLQPLLLNMHSGGGSWRSHRVARSQVLHRMQPIRLWMPAAWPFVLDIVDRACAARLIVDDRDTGVEA
jgi:putative hydrolase of HD superfamily